MFELGGGDEPIGRPDWERQAGGAFAEERPVPPTENGEDKRVFPGECEIALQHGVGEKALKPGEAVRACEHFFVAETKALVATSKAGEQNSKAASSQSKG